MVRTGNHPGLSTARKIVRTKEQIRELCRSLEDLYEELLEVTSEGDVFVIDGKPWALKDNFRDQNSVCRSHYFQQYELVEVPE